MRIYEHKDGFKEIYRVANSIAIAKNPCLFWDVSHTQVPELERRVDIIELESQMQELIA